MSGHSKWAQIKRQKAVVDQKRGRAFTKLARAITLAARQGENPNMNAALRIAITKAQEANMSKENIERAIERAQSDKDKDEALLLEAYGPEGTAFLISTLTDNRNRTVAEIRHILATHEASLVPTGSVQWQFQQQGTQFIPKHPLKINESVQEQVKRLASALSEHTDVLTVTTNIT
jgi:YebC/PmpR family DNA-binding regulatory protein